MTPDEVQRMVLAHDQILNSDNGRFVRRDIYARDLKNVEQDVAEINDSIRWALRLVVAQFFGLIVTLIVVIANATGGI